MALTRFTKIPFNPLTDNNKEVFLSLPPFCFFSRNPQVNFLREIILENLEKEKHGFVRKSIKGYHCLSIPQSMIHLKLRLQSLVQHQLKFMFLQVHLLYGL